MDDLSEEKLKKALLKKALGYVAKEQVCEYSVDENGEEVLSKKKVTKKQLSPDLAALKILLEKFYANTCVEKMSDEFYADCAIKLHSEMPKKLWSGLEDLDGCEISVLADDFSVGKYKVEDGSIDLLEEASDLVVGLSYEHIIEPLPYVADAVRPYSPQALRVISGLFRIINSRSFCIEMGSGYLQVPLKRLFKDEILDAPPSLYSGDVHLRALGWIREMDKPLWSIKSDEPLAFTLLSAVLEVKIKG